MDSPTLPPTHLKVGVVQPSGAPFDTPTAVGRVVAHTAEAGSAGAGLILFPEAFVGGYPWGLTFGTVVGGRTEEGRRTWERYWASAIDVPGPEMERMGEAAREADAYLCVGVIERDTMSTSM